MNSYLVAKLYKSLFKSKLLFDFFNFICVFGTFIVIVWVLAIAFHAWWILIFSMNILVAVYLGSSIWSSKGRNPRPLYISKALPHKGNKTIFCLHIVISLFPIPTKILFVFWQWVCSHSIYHGLHYYIQNERIFDIHPYDVLELKQLASKEAAVKATPTPTTPIHP